MRFARVHKVASYLLALLGLVALTTGGELGGLPTVVLGVGVVLSWFAEGELLASSRYTTAWKAVVVATLVIEGARAALLGLAWLTAAVEFASVLQLYSLANRRTARDYQQITVLAVLHLIAATVLGGGLSYAVCFVGFVIVTPWAMTLGHLRREIEGNYYADARAGRSGVPIDVARILRSRRVVGPGLLVGSSLLAVPIFAMTAVIFVVFPRIGLGIFSLRAPHGGPVTGLGDQVDLAGHGTIRDDPTIVLRIEPPDLGANPPSFRTFRLRGAAFDYYDGRTWSRRSGHRYALRREASEYQLRGRRWATRHDRHYRVVLDPIEPPVVLIPEGAVALRVEPRIEAGLPRYPEITTDSAGELRYAGNDELGLVYTALVSAAPDVSDRSPLHRGEYARYLALPPVSPRFVALAHELTDRYPTASQKAEAVQRYLHGLRYTLAIESGRADRPLEDFLFRTRAGHCEYFSTAMAILLRAVGVPTRNVTGFLGGVFNRYGRFYAIRQGDAHSWVEAYDPARGWVTFDPTPPAREAPVARTGAFAEIDAMIEAMRVRWRRYVIGFDLGTQARLAMRVVRLLEGRPSRRGADTSGSREGFGAVWASLKARAQEVRWERVGLGLVAGATVVAFLRRRRRGGGRRAPSRTAAAREAIALAAALDAALTERGHPRPRNRTPLAHAEDLERARSPLAPLAKRVASRYVAARFGDAPLAPGELDALRRELREAETPPN